MVVGGAAAPAGSQEIIYASNLPNICQPTPLLKRCLYFQEVLETIPLEKASTRLMKLEPGAQILEHCDSFGDNEARIHIPITTNPEVEFCLNGEVIEIAPGNCWFLDFRLPHKVINRGRTSRTHLVVDGISNEWLNDQLAL
jgi:quercetin dioxygenase-like cupin family protein